jgi:hypothetical protein
MPRLNKILMYGKCRIRQLGLVMGYLSIASTYPCARNAHE